LVAGTLLAVGTLAAPAQGARYYPVLDDFVAPDAAQTGDANACDEVDHLAIGGGFASFALYEDGVYLNSSRHGTVGDTSNLSAWTVYADNYTGGSPSNSPTTAAMCDRKGDLADYEYRTSPGNTIGDGVQAGYNASCKNDETVVGGGGVSSGFYADETYLSSSAPFDGGDKGRVPDDGWRAVLNDDEGGNPSSFVDVHATCDSKHKPSDFAYVSRSRKVPDGTQRAESASCGGRQIVGGGVTSKSNYSHGLYISASVPAEGMGEERWTASVDNYDTPDDEARKMVVTAICLK
jgi:hypothetical protein